MPSVSRNNPAPQPPGGGALALSTAWPPWSRCNWRLLISEIVLAPRWSPSSSWLKVLNSPPSQLLPLHAAAERFCTLSVLSTFVIFCVICMFVWSEVTIPGLLFFSLHHSLHAFELLKVCEIFSLSINVFCWQKFKFTYWKHYMKKDGDKKYTHYVINEPYSTSS